MTVKKRKQKAKTNFILIAVFVKVAEYSRVWELQVRQGGKPVADLARTPAKMHRG